LPLDNATAPAAFEQNLNLVAESTLLDNY